MAGQCLRPREGLHPWGAGINSFGLYPHFGGANPSQFTHANNCAASIVLAGFKLGNEGEVLSLVDRAIALGLQVPGMVGELV